VIKLPPCGDADDSDDSDAEDDNDGGDDDNGFHDSPDFPDSSDDVGMLMGANNKAYAGELSIDELTDSDHDELGDESSSVSEISFIKGAVKNEISLIAAVCSLRRWLT